ncbi:hypothetical protein HD554DRAFT_2102031 [Boletus coccyginus]|nr:hypothetical protein HD554DRAFT_2102031 [Boletus coccyginus]
MNLCGETEDKSGFPARDPIPSQILTQLPPTEGAYRTACYAFFTALFDTARGISLHKSRRPECQGAVRHALGPPDVRYERSSQVHAELIHALKRRPSAIVRDTFMSDCGEMDDWAASTDVGEAADKFRGLTLSESSDLSSDPSDSDFAAHLFTAYGKMAASLEKIFADSDQPKLVIVVDEAYLLIPVPDQGPYRPTDVFAES